MSTALFGLGFLTVAILSAGASEASTVRYTLTPLMGTQGDGTSFGHAINNAGQVVGILFILLILTMPHSFQSRHPVEWDHGDRSEHAEGGELRLPPSTMSAKWQGIQILLATLAIMPRLWNGIMATDLSTLGGIAASPSPSTMSAKWQGIPYYWQHLSRHPMEWHHGDGFGHAKWREEQLGPCHQPFWSSRSTLFRPAFPLYHATLWNGLPRRPPWVH